MYRGGSLCARRRSSVTGYYKFSDIIYARVLYAGGGGCGGGLLSMYLLFSPPARRDFTALAYRIRCIYIYVFTTGSHLYGRIIKIIYIYMRTSRGGHLAGSHARRDTARTDWACRLYTRLRDKRAPRR